MSEEAGVDAGRLVSQPWGSAVPKRSALPDLTEIESICENMWKSHIFSSLEPPVEGNDKEVFDLSSL